MRRNIICDCKSRSGSCLFTMIGSGFIQQTKKKINKKQQWLKSNRSGARVFTMIGSGFIK